uniref:Uncharacterized protein n=1 Tax=Myotis myotis TaxID=51298 RepID=A0A7J7SRS1_MYOMY|nr:hypothetical protein mMyoMyo1_009315 [Myotis myotis]
MPLNPELRNSFRKNTWDCPICMASLSSLPLNSEETLKVGGWERSQLLWLRGGLGATFLWIRIHPTPAASTQPSKFDPREIQVVYLRCTGGEVHATSALGPKIGPLGLSPKRLAMTLPKSRRLGRSEGCRKTDRSELTGPD